MTFTKALSARLSGPPETPTTNELFFLYLVKTDFTLGYIFASLSLATL